MQYQANAIVRHPVTDNLETNKTKVTRLNLWLYLLRLSSGDMTWEMDITE